jgi:hypothetical protein
VGIPLSAPPCCCSTSSADSRSAVAAEKGSPSSAIFDVDGSLRRSPDDTSPYSRAVAAAGYAIPPRGGC